jgi:hypothetical protein
MMVASRWMAVWALAGVVGLLPACEAVGRAKATIAELLAVQRAVQQRAGSSPVHVNVMNGSNLTISIVNTPFHDLPADRKKVQAHALAKVAFDAYADRAQLRRVVVVFMVQSGFLLFHYSDGTDAHFFEARELRDDPAVPPTSST